MNPPPGLQLKPHLDETGAKKKKKKMRGKIFQISADDGEFDAESIDVIIDLNRGKKNLSSRGESNAVRNGSGTSRR